MDIVVTLNMGIMRSQGKGRPPFFVVRRVGSRLFTDVLPVLGCSPNSGRSVRSVLESDAKTLTTIITDPGFDEAQVASAAFITRYNGRTLDAYRYDLRTFFAAHASTGSGTNDVEGCSRPLHSWLFGLKSEGHLTSLAPERPAHRSGSED